MADRPRRAAVTLGALLLLLAVGACSDDDSDATGGGGGDAAVEPVDLPPEADPYVDAMTAMFTGEETLPISEDQARCVASRMVQVFQVGRLTAAGIEPDDLAADDMVFDGLELSEEEGLKLADAFQQCGFDFYDAMVDSIVLETADPAAARRCFEGALSREVFRQAMAQSLVADDEGANTAESEAMFAAMSTCTMAVGEGTGDDLGG